jgi:methionyl-tRNA formyltransferase
MVPGLVSVMARTIVIATPHARYDELERALGTRAGWNVVRLRDRAALSSAHLADLQAEWIFLPHWSWLIPADVYEAFACVVFHMTDLPYGRGGSPLQNLIVRGHRDTMLSALRCSAGLDTGPVYLKRRLSLAGTAEEIFARAAGLMEDMIIEIVVTGCLPQPQTGEVVTFHRRTPAQSDISGLTSLEAVHDHIRMLDADGYPPAFVQVGGLRFEFKGSRASDGELHADVRITLADRDPTP